MTKPREVGRHAVLLIAAGLALAGCGAVGGGSAASRAAPDAVTQSVEEGGKFLVLKSPAAQHGEAFMGIAGTNFYLLRTLIDRRTGETTHQLYVEDSYTGQARDWDAAQDASGRSLRFIPIGKHEIDCAAVCSYAEEFAAALPEAELRGKGPLTVFFRGKNGAQMAIPVSAQLIAKQLAASDAARAILPTTAAAAEPKPAR